MKADFLISGAGTIEKAELVISDDGKVSFAYFDKIYEGHLSEKRLYGKDVYVTLISGYEQRSFEIRLRKGRVHDAPTRIEFYSEGLPATNQPSRVPPLSVYLTKSKKTGNLRPDTFLINDNKEIGK